MLNLICEAVEEVTPVTISTNTIITMCICGGIIALCIFLLIVMRKRPPKDEKIIARRECQKALDKLVELKKVVEAKDFSQKGRINTIKLIKNLNYARRLAHQVVYDSENTASGAILDNVENAREVAVKIKKGEGLDACINKINYCMECLNNAIKVIDDVMEADKQIRKK